MKKNYRSPIPGWVLLAICLATTNPLSGATVTGVANGADFSTSVAPGSLASIFGTGFATAASSPSTLPFPATFNGVSVTVNGRPAHITFLGPTQINFQVPAATPVGTATVTVAVTGQASGTAQFTVVAAAPGIFQYGTNRGIVQNQDYVLNSAAAPASANSVVIVYLTGIGTTTPAVTDGNAAPGSPLAVPAGQARATIGGQNATVLFLGLTPGAVGLAQANVQIPAQLATGDYPLVLTVNGQTSRSALVAVKSSPLPPAVLGPLPSDFKCVSGSVDFITFSLATKASQMADEVSIGGTKLCANCQLKQPVYGNLVAKLEAARVDGLNVDACYDPFGTMSYLRLRP